MMRWTQDRLTLEVWRLTGCLGEHVDLVGCQTGCDGLIKIYHYEI